MQLHDTRILLTGAAGGIGAALTQVLAARRARLGLVGRHADKLAQLAEPLKAVGIAVEPILADVTTANGRQACQAAMTARFGGIDILINNAGVSEFGEFADIDPAFLDTLLATNLSAPLQLTRLLLPDMLARGSGRIVNIGSIFGSIAFACFAGYSASKFALRGFSEALRRELAGSGVGVTYVAPRAVRTAANRAAVYRMADRIKMPFDAPEQVAEWIVKAIEHDRQDVFLGFPESLFVRINALWPRLVDKALAKQNRIMREFAREG